MIDLNNVLNEILLRLVDIIIQGGKQPEKIIVSDRVYELLMDIKIMPRSVRYENSVFYIADIPVQRGGVLEISNDIWFKLA